MFLYKANGFVKFIKKKLLILVYIT